MAVWDEVPVGVEAMGVEPAAARIADTMSAALAQECWPREESRDPTHT
jgi:hypothetical protein